MKSDKAGENVHKLDVAKAKQNNQTRSMTSFFQKKPSNEVSSEHATTQIEQVTMPSSTLMVSTSPVMTSMGLFPKMLNSTPQRQSTVTILSNYAIAGNDFTLHSSKESCYCFKAM